MSRIVYDLNNNFPAYCRKNLSFRIVQVGVGGNGSYVVQQLSQLLNILDVNARYYLVDPDIIETKNLANQLFLPHEVGKSKASVLAKRYSKAYNVQIGYQDLNFVEDVDTLISYFNHESYIEDGNTINILIGAVDNNFSRKIMHDTFHKMQNLLYIDAGIESANIPEGKTLQDKSNWTKEEKSNFDNTGWTGQVVVGYKERGNVLLAPIADVFPNVLIDVEKEIKPSEQSCSAITVSEPQRVQSNRMAALVIGMYLNEFFSSKQIRNHYTMFHAREGYMRSQPILDKEDDID